MTTQALFQRTGSAEFPSWLKCMISGPPKSGKTSFLGTVPNIVIADTEPHANNLQSVAHLNLPFVTIDSIDDLHRLRFVLADNTLRQQAAESLGMEKIEAVAIDTMDTLQALMKKERMREQRSTKFLRDDWGWLKEEMTAMIEGFTALPVHVFFIVHTKTKDVGTEDNPRTIYLPGLEGSIAESIAGMVGYSLLSYRKEEIRPDGSKYTKYWLRAEGDETYEFLGNRAAGRLPDVIEPHFKVLYDAAMAGRPQQAPPPVQMPQIQTTGQTQQPPAQQPASAQAVGQNPAQAAPPPAQAGPSQGSPALPPNDEPVNAAALGHVKKVYDAIELPFPEERVKQLTLGDARTLVRMWQAAQQDAVEGKGPDPRQVMREYLTGQGWVVGNGETKAAETTPTMEPKVDGTIEQVKAYIDKAEGHLGAVQEAYDLEAAKDSPRISLTDWLIKQGAKVQTSVDTSPPAEPASAVTPTPAPADVTPTEEQAVKTVEEGLGGTVTSQEINEDAKCDECGGPLDDLDLAQLGKSRFSRVLCVSDYIAETKKPRTT